VAVDAALAEIDPEGRHHPVTSRRTRSQ
jgi:hypothetical protein